MVLEGSELANFTIAFRQRFAALFGRKIARQRAEQYLAGLLSGQASRRNVTSLAQTVDGATARSLGWLLNKSPWATRPIVDAVQAYVGEHLGDESGVFALSLASFVKRGDNAVGVAKQQVAHLGRTLNCQIGVFLAYGSPSGSSLVDAALYLPREWTENPVRRHKAGVPDHVDYASRVDLALDLLRRARGAGTLRGQWVIVHQGEGFEPGLGECLAADGWWYLLPVNPNTAVFTSLDDAAPRCVAELRSGVGAATVAQRVWENVDGTPGEALWLVMSPDQQPDAISAFLSNAPETVTAEEFQRVLATPWPTTAGEGQREGSSLDVYRVRGWDGWHRHVTLALLASAFRACLPCKPATPAPAETSAPATDAPEVVPADPVHAEAIDIDADDAAADPAAADESGAIQMSPTIYRVRVQIENTDWKAVRAFQTLLVAQEAGTVLSSSPSRAEIERQEVGVRMEVVFESDHTTEQLLDALAEVPEIQIVEFAAHGDPSATAPADAFVDEEHAPVDGELADASELLAALEAELSARTVAREAGLPSPTEAAADAVAARVSNIQEAAAQSTQPADATVSRTNAATNDGAHPPSMADERMLAPIARPAPPVAESPARSIAPESTAPIASAVPAAPAATAPSANGAARDARDTRDQEPARIEEEQVIVLDVADESYGMPVQRVREIIRVPPITRVPNGPAFLEGVINLRGQVIPVLDLRKHLGVQVTEHTRRSRVVVGELGEYTVGMVVDAVSQVVMVPASNVEPPPSLVASAENGQVRGVARLGDRLVLLLDPDRVLSKR